MTAYERRNLARREWIASTKAGIPCSRCGGSYPTYVLDWHHRDPAEKRFVVNAGNANRSRVSILAEIAKCDLLCANCHREVHFGPS